MKGLAILKLAMNILYLKKNSKTNNNKTSQIKDKTGKYMIITQI